MKITAWQLNQSYQALLRLGSQQIPKDHHKMAYKLSRQIKSAKAEQEDLNDSMQELMVKCGFKSGEQNVPLEKIEDFNRQSKKFMKETMCEIWGDPIKYSEIRDLVSISPLDLADLDWLIIEDEQETEEKAKTAGAPASA